jgi:hypothetical protein
MWIEILDGKRLLRRTKRGQESNIETILGKTGCDTD